MLVIAAGRNAEGTSDKSTSRIEAVAAKLLSECRCVRDLLVLVAGFGRASIARWQCVAPRQEVLLRPGNTGTRHVTRRFHVVRAKPSSGSIVRQGEAQLGRVPVYDYICFMLRVSCYRTKHSGMHLRVQAPAVVHQTYCRDHDGVRASMQRMLDGRAERKLWLDADCIRLLQTHGGPDVEAFYNSLTTPAHRADLFRYFLMYLEGGIYVDMKTCFLQPLESIIVPGALVTVIGRAGSHIHQGVLIVPPRHPCMAAVLCDALRQSAITLNGNKGYMTFCKSFWRLLQEHKGPWARLC